MAPKILKSEFVRNVAKLFSANAIAGIVALAVYPVLTRLYSPDAFGLLNLFNAIAGVLIIVASADYQYAILLPPTRREANAVTYGAIAIVVAVVLLLCLCLPFAQNIADLFNAPALAQYLYLVPIIVLVCALWNITNYWLSRRKLFSYTSAYILTQGTLIPALKLLFAAVGCTLGGLIFGSVVGAVLAFVAVVMVAYWRLRPAIIRMPAHEMRDAVVNYKRFPMFSLPRSVINNLSSNIPSLLLVPFFGLAPIGLFGIGLTFGFRPVNMIENSVYQVFFQRVSQQVNERQSIRATMLQFLRYTALVIVPLVSVALLALSFCVGWLLGDEWIEVGTYLRLLLPWLLISLFAAPICFLSDIFQQQHIALVFEILIIVCRVLGLLIGIWLNDFTAAILGYSIGSCVAIAAQLIWYMILVRRYESGLKVKE